jgi:hypothetical protein
MFRSKVAVVEVYQLRQESFAQGADTAMRWQTY